MRYGTKFVEEKPNFMLFGWAKFVVAKYVLKETLQK
jgi:hypothetical protein